MTDRTDYDADRTAIRGALSDGGEVHARDLMRLTVAGQERIPRWRPAGAAALDLDPDYLDDGEVLAADAGGDATDRVAMGVALAVARLVTREGLPVEYRLDDAGPRSPLADWRPVRADSDATGPGGGYGIAAEQYLYRLAQ